jgi:toxin ParE1/3/4
VSEYIISRPAIRDLESISSYFAEANVEAGERFLKGFNKRCQQLANFPSMGRGYDDVQVGLHRLLDDGIEIVRVANGRQNLRSLFDQLS